MWLLKKNSSSRSVFLLKLSSWDIFFEKLRMKIFVKSEMQGGQVGPGVPCGKAPPLPMGLGWWGSDCWRSGLSFSEFTVLLSIGRELRQFLGGPGGQPSVPQEALRQPSPLRPEDAWDDPGEDPLHKSCRWSCLDHYLKSEQHWALPEKLQVKVTLRGKDHQRVRLKLSTFWDLVFLIVLSRTGGDNLFDMQARSKFSFSEEWGISKFGPRYVLLLTQLTVPITF